MHYYYYYYTSLLLLLSDSENILVLSFAELFHADLKLTLKGSPNYLPVSHPGQL